MNAIRITFLALFSLSCLFSTQAAKKDSWTSLFNGKDLSQFKGYKKDKPGDAWVAEDGVIKLVKVKGKSGGDLMTREQYKFFELQLDWKLPKPGNSGIIYRVTETDGPSYKTGPEMQIFHTMKAGGKTDTGSCYALYAPKVANLKPIGEWNSVRLIIKPGNKVEHHMNGQLLCSYEIGSKDWNDRVAKSKFKNWEKFGRMPKGHLCFQDHGNEVWFRNVRVRKL